MLYRTPRLATGLSAGTPLVALPVKAVVAASCRAFWIFSISWALLTLATTTTGAGR